MWSWTVSLVAFLNFLPRLWQSMRFLDLYWYDRKNKVESPFISNLAKCFFEYCVPFHTACKSILTWLLWVRWKQSAICSPTETFDPRFSNFMPSAGSLVSFCWRDVSTDKYIALGFQTMAAIHKNVSLRGLLMLSMNNGPHDKPDTKLLVSHYNHGQRKRTCRLGISVIGNAVSRDGE